MRTVALNIEMICHFSKEGITPLRFKYKEGDSYKVIKVDKVVTSTTEKLCGNLALVFDC